MEIKNFAVNFASGRAKILAAVFTCLAAIMAIVIFDGIEQKATAGITSDECVLMNSKWNPNNLDHACMDNTDGVRLEWGGAVWYRKDSDDVCHCKTDLQKTSGTYDYNHRDIDGNLISDTNGNLIAKGSAVGRSSATEETSAAAGAGEGTNSTKTLEFDNVGAVCVYNASSPRGLGNVCTGDTYCFPDGKCALGCAITENRQITKWFKSTETTCDKPSNLSADGVYRCQNTTGELLTWRRGDGNAQKNDPNSGLSGYGLNLDKTVGNDGICYSGCVDNGNGTAKCADETKCTNLANNIINAFGCYKNEVKSIIDEYNNNINKVPAEMTMSEAKSAAISRYGQIRTKCAIPDFVAIKTFEKLAYPAGKSPIFSSASSVKFSQAATDLTQDDILCAYNSNKDGNAAITLETVCGVLNVNSWGKNMKCAGAGSLMSAPFKNHSFECVKVDGCSVYSWLKDSNVQDCGASASDGSAEDSFLKSSSYFQKSSNTNSNGVPVIGWGNGAYDGGCEYFSFSQLAEGTSTDKNSNYYMEFKIPTGYCYQSNSMAQAGSNWNCTDYEGEDSGGSEAEQKQAVTFECGDGKYVVAKVSNSQITFMIFDKIACESVQAALENRKMTDTEITECKRKFDECSGSVIAQCFSSSQNRYFVSGESICGKCGYEGTSSLKEGVCYCNEESQWVLQDECLRTSCTDQQDRDEKFTAQCVSAEGQGEDMACSANNDCQQRFGSDYYCIYKSLAGEIGFCSNQGGCYSSSNGNKNFGKGAIICGGDEISYVCENPTKIPSATGWSEYANCPEKGKVCDDDTGFCVGEDEGGEAGKCQLGSAINVGTPNFRYTGCQGAYVKFTLNNTGDCSGGIACEVNDDYNNGTTQATLQQPSAILPTTTTSNWAACVPIQSRYSDTQGDSSADIPDDVHFTVECHSNDGKSQAKGEKACANPYQKQDEQKKEEEDKSCEGEKCKTDDDCQEGLVCVDGKCVTEEEAEENSKTPTVAISSPSGAITTKTAQLSVTTDIAANCKYMLNQQGGLSAGNFDGAGMVLSGAGGTSHSATLSDLTSITATNCKYNHTVTVLCKNSKASAGATGAIGSAQTNFSVDLSQDSSNAPVVVAVMESKYTIANPVLKVTTDRPADCEYKKDSDFTFGAGTKFDTTGSYAHNTQLNDLANADYTYYVVCQDKATCAANKPGLSVRFKVDLSEDPANAPNIVSTTPETQTVANPTLSVTTDRPATCQYKKDVTFAYDGGTQFANDGEYAHSVSLADLLDGKHTFYVACKDKSSGAKKTLETAIVTTLNRGGTAGAPVISNTTPPSQNTNNPTLSVITDRPATCQYKQNADFVYGQGMQFTIDGGTGHSAVLANAADGTYTFYVVCQDPTTQISNVPGAQIIFTVNTASEVCASLSSNDKQNDNERDYSDEDDYNSIYVWRSVAVGTVESFEKVDWHAGYQLTPEEDGYVTQLCGYFDSGARNRVSLYDGNYKELAGAEIDGQGGWNCANIAPIKVRADRRYYVIARVEDDSIYFAYKSGLLPRDAENAVIEAGVRQLAADGDFGESLKKYDYIVFGLVDAKIRFAEENSRGPQVFSPLPDGDNERSDLILSVQTDEDATCKFDREDLEYKNMRYTFGATGQKLHQQKICSLDDGPFTWHVRCKGVTDTNDGSTAIQFEVDD